MNKKIIASVLAVAFAFSMAGPVGAITDAEYQTLVDQLASLTTLYNTLLAQTTVPTTSATAVCFNTDLQKGMTSDSVKDLQIKLGVTPTSGYFGPITLAAVKTFQTSNGIINTGYVGPLTRGALNDLYCTAVVPSTTYPAGCTSAVGFSTTTGLSCSGAVTYPAGCTSAVGFSTTTGLSCSGVVSYPAGCTSAVGYSSTTGDPCSGTTTVGATEGTLTVTQYAIPASGTVTVYGGGINKEIAAYKMKATSSDIRVKRFLVQVGIATDFPWRDLSSISLWDGSTLLKEVAVNSTNLTEVTWATTYQLTFDGLDLLLAKDAEKIISLKVSALAVPQYKGAITTLIPANGVRGVDTANLNVYGPATVLTAYSFTTAAADAPSVTLSAAIDNPLSGNALVSKTATTRVDLLKFNVKVENIDATFKSGTINVDTNSNFAMSAVELYDGATLLASAATTTTGALTWSTFTLPVSAGVTKVLTVKGVVSASTTISGESLKVTGTVNAALSGVDTNGATLSLTHSAVVGGTIKVYTASPTFALTSASSVRSDSSTTTINDVGDFTIGISITANGGDIYLPAASNTSYGNTKGASAGFYPTIDVGAGALNASSSTWTCDSNAIEGGTTDREWRIPSGATSVCTVYVNASNKTSNGYYNVSMNTIVWDTVTALGGAVSQNTGLTALKAPALLLKF